MVTGRSASDITNGSKKYWTKLKGQQKVGMKEILLSMLDFAASYNSYTNRRTFIYLDMLQKVTSEFDANVEKQPELDEGNKLDRLAEQKLATFCEHVLKEASDFHLDVGETTKMEIHRVLELHSPIILKVIKDMSSMNDHVFRKHLREFYPFFTKLVCCDQMDICSALGDLFSGQLMPLLPLVESAH
ncbi:hypothetical protein V2J09_003987 [Rumex salicifolius]